MKKALTLFTLLFLALGWASAQDVYFAGNNNGTGKIWKNDTLVHSITDTLNVTLNALQVAPDGTLYTAGCIFNTEQSIGRVWQNNDILFSVGNNTVINALNLNGNDWTAAGTDKNAWDVNQGVVWQNGEVLHAYSDSLVPNEIYAMCIDTVTGDIYSGGITDTVETAKIWKNDIGFWEAELPSSVCCLYHDGTNLYAGGYYYLEGLLMATLWENGEVLYSFGDSLTSTFQAIDIYDGDIYTAGYADDSVFVWKNGEVLFSHPVDEFGCINAICVNEYGVYYAGHIDYAGMVWKDGEVLYEPDDCEEITTLVVMTPEPPQPTFTLTVLVDSIGGGTVTGGGIYYYGDTATIEAIPDMGAEFLYWNDSISDNPRDIIITQDTTFIALFNRFEYTIETAVIPMDAGTVTGGGTYHYGDTLELEAVPNPGYVFERWIDSVTDNPRSVVVTQDSLFIAVFGARQYTINVVSDHPGWGSVTGGGTFYYGDTIEISASPYLGFAFAGWTDGNISNPRTVIVTQDETFTAHFEIRQCIITTHVSPEGAGTVNGGGTYNYGETIHLTAHSNTGYVYSMWDDGVMDNPRSVFVEGDATYTAVFTPLQYQITTECDPVEGGTVTGAGTYDYGCTATLTATANENYMFICWSDGIVTNPRTVTVTGNANYKALFHLNGTPQYTITVLANDPTLGSVTGSGTYPEGTTIDISATPNPGAYFTGWDDGNNDNPRSVTVTQNMTFTAIFTEVQTFTITVRPEYPLQGTTYGGGTYPAGTVINIGATPNINFYFSGWQDGNMDNPRSITVTEDAEYVASFSQNPVQTYTVTVYYDESQGFIIGAGTYTAGATASIAAIPADGFVFKKWNDDTTDNPKVVVVDHDIFLAAFFESNDVDENSISGLLLYPNPANDIIHIDGLEGEHEVTIYNAVGALVKTVNISDDNEIAISELSEGLYLIRIDNRHAMRFVKKQ